jgi:Tfp pilus assembly protein PilN
MTAVLAKGAAGSPWHSMPGWGIVADLTPPELSAARRLKALQRLIGAGLAVVIALCVGGYVWAKLQHGSAADALDAANARTTELTVEQAKYAHVTQVEALTKGIDGQVGVLMVDDVDVPVLLAKLRAALPGTMSLTSVNLTLTSGPAATSPTTSLDTSGGPTIGTVTMTGSAEHMADVADYVSSLSAVRGIVNVVPSSNNAGAAGGAQWTLTLQLTDNLYTHRYDATPGSN